MLASLLLIVPVLSFIPSRTLPISLLVVQVEVLGLTSALMEVVYDDKRLFNVRSDGDNNDIPASVVMVESMDCIIIAGVLELRR